MILHRWKQCMTTIHASSMCSRLPCVGGYRWKFQIEISIYPRRIDDHECVTLRHCSTGHPEGLGEFFVIYTSDENARANAATEKMPPAIMDSSYRWSWIRFPVLPGVVMNQVSLERGERVSMIRGWTIDKLYDQADRHRLLRDFIVNLWEGLWVAIFESIFDWLFLDSKSQSGAGPKLQKKINRNPSCSKRKKIIPNRFIRQL